MKFNRSPIPPFSLLATLFPNVPCLGMVRLCTRTAAARFANTSCVKTEKHQFVGRAGFETAGKKKFFSSACLKMMHAAEYWLSGAEEWWEVLYNPPIGSRPRVRVEPLLLHRRKRRREDQSRQLPPYKRGIVLAPRRAALWDPAQRPLPTSEISQAVLNAFAAILPIEARFRLLGQLHDVLLVAALYRRQNLVLCPSVTERGSSSARTS